MTNGAKTVPPFENGHPRSVSNRRTQLLILSFIILSAFIQPSFAQLQKIDSLLAVLQTTKEDTSKVKLLYKISDEYLDTKPDSTIEYASQGLVLAQKLLFKRGQSICLNALGLGYYRIGKLDTSLICFEKRHIIVKELKDSLGIAGVYDNMATIYIHYGKNEKALELRKKANDIYFSLNEKINLASGYTWIGNIYKEEGEYAIALENYIMALKTYEEENNEREIGYPLINISSVYRYLKQYEKAKQYALDAKTKFAKANIPEGVGMALYRLSLVYSNEGDFENTIKYLKEAKAIFEDINALYYQTLANTLLGTTYHEHGDNKSALGYFNTALPIAQQIGNKSSISMLYQNIGTTYFDKGDFRKALEYMHKSDKILKEINDKNSLLEISENFIVIYAHLNQPENVEKYFKRFHELSDTIFNEQSTKSIAEMQTKYETEKKDKEILTLNLDAEKKKNTIWAIASGFTVLFVLSGSGFMVFRNKKKREQAILNQQAAELSRLVSESDMKALRSQMNPHFIFNCIHTIDRLLNDLRIPESKICLENFSKLTRTVLENSKKREISLSEEIETLRLYMDLENMRFRNPFTYNIEVEPGIDRETTLVPPLILQPFIENSIKHGFRDPEKPGQIRIEIRNENEYLVCSVEDNGIGRTNAVNIKTSSGFKKESLGIKLTEERLDLISKTKNVQSYFSIKDLVDDDHKPAGTRVKMFLPYELSI